MERTSEKGKVKESETGVPSKFSTRITSGENFWSKKKVKALGYPIISTWMMNQLNLWNFQVTIKKKMMKYKKYRF